MTDGLQFEKFDGEGKGESRRRPWARRKLSLQRVDPRKCQQAQNVKEHETTHHLIGGGYRALCAGEMALSKLCAQCNRKQLDRGSVRVKKF